MKEIDLMQLVIEVDDELIREGKEPFQRPFLACHRVVKRLKGYTSSTIWPDPLFDEIDKIYKNYTVHQICICLLYIWAHSCFEMFFSLLVFRSFMVRLKNL